MSQTVRAFEETVRDRALQSLNYGIAQCGGFVTVGDLQQYACGWLPAAPEQVASLARRFGVRVPPGYGQAAEKAA